MDYVCCILSGNLNLLPNNMLENDSDINGQSPIFAVGEEKEQPRGTQEGEMRSRGAPENLSVQSGIPHLPGPAVPVSLTLLKSAKTPFELSPELVWVQSQSQFTP